MWSSDPGTRTRDLQSTSDANSMRFLKNAISTEREHSVDLAAILVAEGQTCTERLSIAKTVFASWMVTESNADANSPLSFKK